MLSPDRPINKERGFTAPNHPRFRQCWDERQVADPTAARLIANFARIFNRRPDAIAAAPGRIEFVGNHTDYNHGPVIGAAINRETYVAVAARTDDRWRFASDYDEENIVDLPGTGLQPQTRAAAWVNYPLGVVRALKDIGAADFTGIDVLVSSTLPVGAGLSSSAALELATAFALLELGSASVPLEQIVTLCRRAENEFVGVPCGILDQTVSAYGRRDHLVYIDCATGSCATIRLPSNVHFWVFNTHTKHALVNGLYAERHRECCEAATALGVQFLAQASPELLADSPCRMPEPVQRRAQHVIDEIARVRACRELLRTGDMAGVGRILMASHTSSSALFENSTKELDFLVATVVGMQNVFGARLTGGGFGGAVLAVTNADFSPETAATVARSYRRHFNAPVEVLHLLPADGARVLRPNSLPPAA